MFQAADSFVKKDGKTYTFQANLFHRHIKTLLDDLHALHLEQNKEKFPNFGLFLVTKI